MGVPGPIYDAERAKSGRIIGPPRGVRAAGAIAKERCYLKGEMDDAKRLPAATPPATPRRAASARRERLLGLAQALDGVAAPVAEASRTLKSGTSRLSVASATLAATARQVQDAVAQVLELRALVHVQQEHVAQYANTLESIARALDSVVDRPTARAASMPSGAGTVASESAEHAPSVQSVDEGQPVQAAENQGLAQVCDGPDVDVVDGQQPEVADERHVAGHPDDEPQAAHVLEQQVPAAVVLAIEVDAGDDARTQHVNERHRRVGADHNEGLHPLIALANMCGMQATADDVPALQRLFDACILRTSTAKQAVMRMQSAILAAKGGGMSALLDAAESM